MNPHDKIAWHRDGAAKEALSYFMDEYRKYQAIADARGCHDDVRKGSLKRAKAAFARAMEVKLTYGI
ncbi:MAG: hypothetical protein IKZ87_01650 [Actinomycetaceae bacterium]|nr:hypothetical protein [Actinomycetaceae bacterium]